MDLETCVGWSLPIFAVVISRLKGSPQNTALWVYLWCLSGVYLFIEWQGYHLYLAGQQIELGFIKPNALCEYLLTRWGGNVLMAFVMALPPFWYWRDRRKMHTQTA